MKRTMYITENNNTSRCDKITKNGHKTLQIYISPSRSDPGFPELRAFTLPLLEP